MSTKFEVKGDTSLDDWIDGVSYLQADVTIYRNPALLAEYRPLLARIDDLEGERAALVEDAPESDPEASLASKKTKTSHPRIADIDAELETLMNRAEELYKKFTADVEVWTMRKIEDLEVAEIQKELGPSPEMPKKLPKNARAQVRAERDAAIEAWSQEMMKYTSELNVRCVHRAALKVHVKGKDREVPDLDGMRRILHRPGGTDHINELAKALHRLSAEGVDIVAPHRSGS